MAVDHYNVWLDDALIATIPAPLTMAGITGLPAGSLHDVEISAVDDAGNESDRSGLAEFRVFFPGPIETATAAARVFAIPRTYENPQLAYPLRFTARGFALDESDTTDEYKSIAWFTLRTPMIDGVGWRPEAPGIGTPDATFSLSPGRIVATAVAQADLRIAALTSEQRDPLADEVARILVQIQPPSVNP